MKYELVNFCEFDKYAAQSFCAIHNISEDKNLGDITKVNEKEIDDFNMMVGGSPCQSFSVAGKQEGAKWTCNDCNHEYNPLKVHYTKRKNCPKCNSENIDKTTTSSLVVDWLRVLEAKKPNFAIYENVKNLVGKFRETFDLIINEIQEYGYNTHWKVLNAKDFGISQNRERVYLIIVKKELDNGLFKFSEGFDNGVRLKDVLDKEVDKKYYISDEKVAQLLKSINYKIDASAQQGGGRQPHIIEDFYSNRDVREYEDYSPTLRADRQGLKVIEEDRFVILHNIYGGFKEKEPRIFEEYSPTIRTAKGGGHIPSVLNNRRIRKLTPKECFRLMGFTDEDFNKARESGISDTQLYKQAGNSIVVDVLYYIVLELKNAMPYLFEDLKLGSFFSGIGAFEAALGRLH